MLKSPLSASRGRATPAKFADALRGPNSPAKKLDFGVPKNRAESSRSSASSSSRDVTTPDQQSTSSTTLVSSPESKFKSSAFRLDADETQEMDDYFSSPRRLTTIPLETPPLDPQSAHFPGFMIHYDTHAILECARSASVEPAPMNDSCSDTDTDKDGQKENIAPRRRARKPPLTSDVDPALLKMEIVRHGKAMTTPATPKKNPLSVGAREGPMTPTPRRPGSGRLMIPSPGMTPVVRERERLERRRILEVEVDGVRCEDEEEAF